MSNHAVAPQRRSNASKRIFTYNFLLHIESSLNESARAQANSWCRIIGDSGLTNFWNWLEEMVTLNTANFPPTISCLPNATDVHGFSLLLMEDRRIHQSICSMTGRI